MCVLFVRRARSGGGGEGAAAPPRTATRQPLARAAGAGRAAGLTRAWGGRQLDLCSPYKRDHDPSAGSGAGAAPGPRLRPALPFSV